MRIALLTGGPSLSDHWCDDFTRDYDRVICVNSAAALFPCDYLAFVDRVHWERVAAGTSHRPRRGFITHAGYPVPAGVERIGLPLYDRHSGRVPLDLAERQGVTECAYTFPSALMVAQDMAAGGRLDLYGFDCSSTPDVAGIHYPGSHTGGRWGLELPWVRHCWGSNITVYGNASAAVLAWLYGFGPESNALASLSP